MLLAMVDDIRVILVKLADRLQYAYASHMSKTGSSARHRNPGHLRAHRHRLGMSKIKNELEELSSSTLIQRLPGADGQGDNKRKAAEAEIDYLKKTVMPS